MEKLPETVRTILTSIKENPSEKYCNGVALLFVNSLKVCGCECGGGRLVLRGQSARDNNNVIGDARAVSLASNGGTPCAAAGPRL